MRPKIVETELSAPSCRNGLLHLKMAGQKGNRMGRMVRFDPCIHLPATEKECRRLENALWEGWELMVDETSGDVWIGDREERITKVAV